jgi:hypothetical protein
MSRALYLRPLALAWLLALPACASTGRSNALQTDVGRATRPDIEDKVPRILDQQGYEVQERRDTGNVIQYMTSWVTRMPFEDEGNRGATECRTRLTIEAREQGNGFYAVTLKAENTMQRALDGQWVNLAPTTMFRRHLRDLTEALALEINMGVRTR